MIIPISKDIDMMALGNWLAENVGPIWHRATRDTPSTPLHTPYSKGRRWVIDRIWYKGQWQLVIEVDLRTIKPHARTDLLLRWG